MLIIITLTAISIYFLFTLNNYFVVTEAYKIFKKKKF